MVANFAEQLTDFGAAIGALFSEENLGEDARMDSESHALATVWRMCRATVEEDPMAILELAVIECAEMRDVFARATLT